MRVLPSLRGYAAVNPGEFFAVATEVFFDRPADLAEAKPDLYDVLRDVLPPGPGGPRRPSPPPLTREW